MNTSNHLTIGKALLWLGGYFCVMLLYTAIDIVLWKKLENPLSAWLNLATMLIFTILYIKVSAGKNAWHISLKSNASVKGILLAFCCAVLFYFLLDKCLDPFFEGLFPASQEAYQDSLLSLAESPVPSFIHVCLLAPVTEEILMRGICPERIETYLWFRDCASGVLPAFCPPAFQHGPDAFRIYMRPYIRHSLSADRLIALLYDCTWRIQSHFLFFCCHAIA